MAADEGVGEPVGVAGGWVSVPGTGMFTNVFNRTAKAGPVIWGLASKNSHLCKWNLAAILLAVSPASTLYCW